MSELSKLSTSSKVFIGVYISAAVFNLANLFFTFEFDKLTIGILFAVLAVNEWSMNRYRNVVDVQNTVIGYLRAEAKEAS